MRTISQPPGPSRRNKTKNKLCWLLVLALTEESTTPRNPL